MSNTARRICPSFIALIFALFSGLCASQANAAIAITFNLKNGQTVGDIASVVATVKSPVLIDQVQFYLDDKLEATITGVPYQFDWNTITGTEGKHTIKAVVTDDNGNTKTASISLIVDNHLSLGAPALEQQAQDALKQNNLQLAKLRAECALKADPTYIQASDTLAQLALGNYDYVGAKNLLVSAKNLSKNVDAMQTLVTAELHMLLIPDYSAQTSTLLSNVLSTEKQIGELKMSMPFQGSSDVQLEKKVEVLLSAAMPDQADALLKPLSSSQNPSLTVLTLQGLVDIALHKYNDSLVLLAVPSQQNTDNYSLSSVYALSLVLLHHPAEALNALKPGITASNTPSLIVGSYALMMQGHFTKSVAMADKAHSQSPDAGDALFALHLATRDAQVAQSTLHSAVFVDPLQPGIWVQLSAERELLANQPQTDIAQQMTQFGLTIDSKNAASAIPNGLLLALLKDNNRAKALLNQFEPLLNGAPDVLLAMASYANTNGDGGLAQRILTQSSASDPAHFASVLPQTELQSPPSLQSCFRILTLQSRYRPGYFLNVSILFPELTATVKN